MPVYLSRFRCLGPDCESNCCTAGWTLPVDRESYERYQQLDDPQLGPELRQRLVRIGESGSPHAWAQLALRDSDNGCHFLTNEGLCGLQLRAGEDMLCLTCAVYPRVSTIVDGTVQRAAKLSCPEIVRLALLDPHGMELLEREEPAGARESLAAEVTTASAGEGDLLALFPMIRSYLVQLVSNRQAAIETRLLAVGLALEQLSAAVGEQVWSGDPQASTVATNRPISEHDVRSAFESQLRDLPLLEQRLAGQPANPIQLELLMELETQRFFGAAELARYTGWVRRLQSAFATADGRADGASSWSKYQWALQHAYIPYLSQRPYLLENLLINYVYASAFPFMPGSSLFDEYVTLVARYVLTKLHLVAAAVVEGSLTDELVVEVIHVLERAVDHNAPYRAHILELIRAKNGTTMDRLPALIVG